MTAERMICLSCGVFKRDLQELIDRGTLHFRTMFLDSMLHMQPPLLEKKMEEALAAFPEERFLLLYGDCCPGMQNMQNRPGCGRVEGLNCCEIFLGHELYKELQRETAFIFLPEWATRWREIFHRELGFENQDVARFFMKEYCRRFVYVDTGVVPVLSGMVQEIEDFFQIPVEVIAISLAPLSTALAEAVDKLSQRS